MALARNALQEIKRELDALIGERITIRANGGRRKTVERTGTLEETYPSVFIVRLDQPQNSFKRVSYSYADILTETVELTVTSNNKQLRIAYNKR